MLLDIPNLLRMRVVFYGFHDEVSPPCFIYRFSKNATKLAGLENWNDSLIPLIELRKSCLVEEMK